MARIHNKGHVQIAIRQHHWARDRNTRTSTGGAKSQQGTRPNRNKTTPLGKRPKLSNVNWWREVTTRDTSNFTSVRSSARAGPFCGDRPRVLQGVVLRPEQQLVRSPTLSWTLCTQEVRCWCKLWHAQVRVWRSRVLWAQTLRLPCQTFAVGQLHVNTQLCSNRSSVTNFKRDAPLVRILGAVSTRGEHDLFKTPSCLQEVPFTHLRFLVFWITRMSVSCR